MILSLKIPPHLKCVVGRLPRVIEVYALGLIEMDLSALYGFSVRPI